jgi:hypothetical protein
VNENTDKQREFDWGPPGNSFVDSLKEWLLYLFLVLLLVAGAWFLLDVNGQAVPLKSSSLQTEGGKSDATTQSGGPFLVPEPVNMGRFFVQLGAFAEKKSALEALQAIKDHGYDPNMAEPDGEYEIYRVSLGPYNTESEAEEIAGKLNSLDFHCFVISSP